MEALDITQSDIANQKIKYSAEILRTSFDVENKSISFFPVKSQNTQIDETSLQSSHVITRSEDEGIEAQETNRLSKPRKNEADGTVLEIEAATVKCEIYSNNKNRIINLSTALFEHQITIGMPFTVFLDETSGYRRLLIKDRKLNEKNRLQGNDEMAAMINEL